MEANEDIIGQNGESIVTQHEWKQSRSIGEHGTIQMLYGVET